MSPASPVSRWLPAARGCVRSVCTAAGSRGLSRPWHWAADTCLPQLGREAWGHVEQRQHPRTWSLGRRLHRGPSVSLPGMPQTRPLLDTAVCAWSLCPGQVDFTSPLDSHVVCAAVLCVQGRGGQPGVPAQCECSFGGFSPVPGDALYERVPCSEMSSSVHLKPRAQGQSHLPAQGCLGLCPWTCRLSAQGHPCACVSSTQGPATRLSALLAL